MFDEDAAVHHDEDSGLACFLRGFFVNDTFLHPNGGHFELDRLIDDFLNELRPAKDIDDVNFFRHVVQRPIGFLAEAFFDPRIYRNHSIALALHVG